MRLAFKVLLMAGALVATGLGTLAPASATTSLPGIQTTNFVCNNGVCAIGPGDVGMPFAAAMIGTGGPVYTGPECNPYLMKVVSGSLPPGLQLGEPICEWEITGTPTAAGTFTFTVQIAPQPNNLGQAVGPDGTQRFSIMIGTGSSDRVVLTRAVWSPHKNKTLQVAGFDVNNGATYTVYVTSTGAELGTITERTPYNGGDGTFVRNFSESTDLNNLTVTDSLGGSATIPVTVNNKYS
jgi:hypothetical protein